MNRGEKIPFAIGLVIVLIDIVIGIISLLLLSKYPEVALDLQAVSLYGIALFLVYITIFVIVFMIRNR